MDRGLHDLCAIRKKNWQRVMKPKLPGAALKIRWNLWEKMIISHTLRDARRPDTEYYHVPEVISRSFGFD